MTKDELVEAGAQALSDAWKDGVLLSQNEPGGRWFKDYGKFAATVLDAVENLIRADEVERRFGWVSREDARAWFLADLRAQVEALPSEYDAAEQLVYVIRADVLALIDGGSDDQ